MSEKKFGDRLDGYVEVKDRIKLFYEAHPEGRLTTTEVRATAEPDGVPRVWVEAAAYRTPDDPHPGRGWSWLVLPGSTPYTRGSEIENAETSAWGRAIGSLGIGIDKSIASAHEVRTKQGTPNDSPVRRAPAASSSAGAGELWRGAVSKRQAPVDGQLRQTPDGPAFGFAITDQNGKTIQVLALGPLADALAIACADGLPAEAEVDGDLEMVPWEKKQPDGTMKAMPPFRRVIAKRIATGDWTLPADIADAAPAAISPAPRTEQDELDALSW